MNFSEQNVSSDKWHPFPNHFLYVRVQIRFSNRVYSTGQYQPGHLYLKLCFQGWGSGLSWPEFGSNTSEKKTWSGLDYPTFLFVCGSDLLRNMNTDPKETAGTGSRTATLLDLPGVRRISWWWSPGRWRSSRGRGTWWPAPGSGT